MIAASTTTLPIPSVRVGQREPDVNHLPRSSSLARTDYPADVRPDPSPVPTVPAEALALESGGPDYSASTSVTTLPFGARSARSMNVPSDRGC